MPSMFSYTHYRKWVFLFCFVISKERVNGKFSVAEGGLLQYGESPISDETHLTVLWRIIVKLEFPESAET